MEYVISKQKQKRKNKNMSKKIIAGALSVATVVSSFAIFGGAAFAASNLTAWHQVSVSPNEDLILGGTVSAEITLAPSIEAIATNNTRTMSVKSTEPWILEWMAVTGEYDDEDVVAAPGTRLGTTGFANAGGYAYAGQQTAATIGNNQWGAVIGVTGTNVTLVGDGGPTLGLALSEVASGTSTVDAVITPTYSAATTGSLGTTKYYGTIYYKLSADE